VNVLNASGREARLAVRPALFQADPSLGFH